MPFPSFQVCRRQAFINQPLTFVTSSFSPFLKISIIKPSSPAAFPFRIFLKERLISDTVTSGIVFRTNIWTIALSFSVLPGGAQTLLSYSDSQYFSTSILIPSSGVISVHCVYYLFVLFCFLSHAGSISDFFLVAEFI